jgi:hypothetical protein
MLADSTSLRLKPDAATWRELDGETVVLHLESATYLSLNEVATVLWRRLADGATRAELLHAVLEEFDAPADEVEADIEAFLTTCRQHGLIDEA